ncbi:hypothetical protein [Methylosinus sporium]|uniref:hypothetical protein n=1 Tax=Methylosinus sporium TaxID=428 RepID=UPI00163D418F|nr:hypothetical protein [Methylosinus sporium]
MARLAKFTSRDRSGNAKLDCSAIIAYFAGDAILEAVVASITIRAQNMAAPWKKKRGKS